MSNDIKPVAMSIAQAAKAWSVSRGSAYAIIRANPWIRVIKIHGTKRAIPYEDVASYVSRCAVVGIAGQEQNKMRSIKAANASNAAQKAARAARVAKAARANKPPAAPSPDRTPASDTAAPAAMHLFDVRGWMEPIGIFIGPT
jgi:hypothetical protein